MPGTGFPSFFCLQQPYTSVQSEDPHDTGKHFTPASLSKGVFFFFFHETTNNRLRCCSSVWAEWSDSGWGKRKNERERLVRERWQRLGEATRDRWRGWRNWKSSQWQQQGPSTIREYCLKSICHLGAVELVITMWYSPFHRDNLFSAVPVHRTPRLYKGRCPLSVCASLAVSVFVKQPTVHPFYQGDLPPTGGWWLENLSCCENFCYIIANTLISSCQQSNEGKKLNKTQINEASFLQNLFQAELDKLRFACIIMVIPNFSVAEGKVNALSFAGWS